MRELDDVKSLFAEIGVSGSSYKEIARDDLARESLSRWPLLSTCLLYTSPSPRD